MIRLRVFIPALLIVGLVTFVVIYKLDFWVKHWIENGISAITDTRTDIDDLKLSFKNSSLHIQRLQVASKEDEFKNAIELEDVLMGFEVLPLLKKRVVIDHFSVTGIKWGTPRSTSGKLPPRLISKKPSWFSDVTNKAFESLKLEASKLPATKLLDFRIPTDPREALSSLNLRSEDAYKNVVTMTQEMRETWKVRLDQLQNIQEYQAKINDARKLAEGAPTSPQDVLNRVQTIQQTVEFFKAEQKKMQALIDDVKKDAGKAEAQLQAARAAVTADFEKAKSLVSLDSLNLDNLSKLLFGEQWIARAEQVLKYQAMLRAVLAHNKANENVQIQQRAKGRDIIFIVPKKQPGFVLADSKFSVKGLDAQQIVSQLYELTLKDINSSPRLYGKPSSVDFRAQLKDMVVGDIHFLAMWDYTTDLPKDSYKLEATKIKADTWPVGIPKVFPIKIASGGALASSELSFVGDEMKWKSHIAFQNVSWDLNEVPKNGIIIPILEDVFGRIKNFYLDLDMKSVKSGINYQVTSDLDTILRTAISKAIEKQWLDFQDRLHHEIEDRVARFRQDAEKEVNQFKTAVEDRVNSYLAETNKYISEGSQLQESLKKKATNAAQEKVKENLKGLQKNLPENPFKSLPKF